MASRAGRTPDTRCSPLSRLTRSLAERVAHGVHLNDPLGQRLLLWRRLMGTTVLDPGVPIQAGLHVYAHCQRGSGAA